MSRKALSTSVALSIAAKADRIVVGLYTDESPGLKVDPVVVLVLSLGFIFSVVALHSGYTHLARSSFLTKEPVIAKVTRRFSS